MTRRLDPSTCPPRLHALLSGVAVAAAAVAAAAVVTAASPVLASNGGSPENLPQRLSDTGLYVAGSTRSVNPAVAAFSPQYPLWSDGSDKRRWLWLPPGSAIDASAPDAWVFPVGTRLWKEFSHAGRAIETRYIERRADGTWQFATYVWDADGRDAVLAPVRGVPALPVAAAPTGRYVVPARADCLVCHGDAPVPVLGVGALQLSPDRDPLAAHGAPARDDEVDLRGLARRGWVRSLPQALLDQPPRIAAATPTERATLGYLHGNCAHCHHRSGTQVPLRLTLAQSVLEPDASRREVLASMLAAPSRYQPPGTTRALAVVEPGHAAASVLALRMQSRHAQMQMPPLGTQVPDAEGLALVNHWITQDTHHPQETRP